MTTEDAVTGLTAASEPQLQPPRINEASIPLFLDGTTTTDARGDSKEENRIYTTKTTTTSKSIKLKKMQPRTRNLSVPLSRSKSEKNNNAKGIRIEMILWYLFNNWTSQVQVGFILIILIQMINWTLWILWMCLLKVFAFMNCMYVLLQNLSRWKRFTTRFTFVIFVAFMNCVDVFL